MNPNDVFNQLTQDERNKIALDVMWALHTGDFKYLGKDVDWASVCKAKKLLAQKVIPTGTYVKVLPGEFRHEVWIGQVGIVTGPGFVDGYAIVNGLVDSTGKCTKLSIPIKELQVLK